MQNALLVHQCLNQLLTQLNNTNSYSLSLIEWDSFISKCKTKIINDSTDYSSGLREKDLVLFYINILLEKLNFEVFLAYYEIWCYITINYTFAGCTFLQIII